RPHGPRDTFALGRAAMDSGQFRLGITLLQDFAQRFPQDPLAVPALLLAAQHAAEHLNNTRITTRLLNRIEALGVAADDSRLQQLREAIKEK
ncbi:MAG: hypothetical protein HKN70_07245, partial [Gammaproteobacteria bacterium]|nr:hypothetical protein [Gammaproteobacteria bacterium]